MNKNHLFDEIIRNEILVDYKDIYERNMSWFYYIRDEIEFPFIAYIEFKDLERRKLFRKINVLDLLDYDPGFEHNLELKVEFQMSDYIMECPISKLEKIKAPESTIKVIELWKYWISQYQ